MTLHAPALLRASGRVLLDLLLPPRCPACGAVAPQVLCAPCLAELGELALPGGMPVELAPAVLAVGAYAYEGAMRAAIHEVKVHGHHAAAAGLGALLRARLSLPAPGAGVALTWVPTAPAKRRRRGWDLPRALAGPGAARLLRAVGDRADQTALDPQARRANPAGAFAAVGPVQGGVVLVDDVRTTGATAAAAAEALIAAGARRVLVATLAVGGDDARMAAAAGGRVTS